MFHDAPVNIRWFSVLILMDTKKKSWTRETFCRDSNLPVPLFGLAHCGWRNMSRFKSIKYSPSSTSPHIKKSARDLVEGLLFCGLLLLAHEKNFFSPIRPNRSPGNVKFLIKTPQKLMKWTHPANGSRAVDWITCFVCISAASTSSRFISLYFAVVFHSNTRKPTREAGRRRICDD